MTIEPTLYIIMRKDLPDMNPGKAMAQAAHAQADFDLWAQTTIHRLVDLYKRDYLDQEQTDALNAAEAISRWRGGRNFGRTLVLQADSVELPIEADSYGIASSVKEVIDPTYPYRNWYGDTFTMNTVTCWWMFVHNDSLQEELEFVKIFPLHP